MKSESNSDDKIQTLDFIPLLHIPCHLYQFPLIAFFHKRSRKCELEFIK